jgi:hypothetical protein
MSLHPSVSPQPGNESQPEDLTVGAGFDFTDPHSPLAPFYLRTSHVVAAALILGVFLLLNFTPMWHTDVWGHLKFGQWIVNHRALPQTDPFCPFADTQPVALCYSWLGQSVLYLLYHAGELLAGDDELVRMAGGVALLRFGHAILAALRCLVLFLAFRRVSGSPALAALALAVMLVLSVGNIAILRPQVLGELFFACLLLTLSRPVLSRQALLLVPLLLVAWANSHGSFPCGLFLLSVVATGRGLEVLRLRWRGEAAGLLADTQLRRLIVVLAASMAAVALLNPAGPRIYLDTLRMADHPNVRLMDEWQPLSFHLGGGGHWAYLGVVLLVVGTQIACRRWFSTATLLLLVAFGVPPLLRQRFFLWWVTIAPWLLVRYWPECGERLRQRLSEYHSVPSFRKTVMAGLLVVLALVWSIPCQWLVAGQPAPLEETLTIATPWPLTHQLRHPDAEERGLPELRRHLAHYPGGRFQGCVFASETLGDLFVWDLAPQVPVFVYSHVHLFPPEHWRRVAAVRQGTQHWRLVLDHYRVNLVVVEPNFNARLCDLLRQDKEWKVVLDESGDPKRRDPRQQLFVAVRVRPR